METAEEWLKKITIDIIISNIPSLLYSEICKKIKSNCFKDINEDVVKKELVNLGILNIYNSDSKKQIDLDDPADYFINVISIVENSYENKISIDNIIIRNEWHTQLNLICNKNEYTIHILYISKDLIPNPDNKNDSIILIMEPFLLEKRDYIISNSYSIDESLNYDIYKEQWKTSNHIMSEIIINSLLKKTENLLNSLINIVISNDDKKDIEKNINNAEKSSFV